MRVVIHPDELTNYIDLDIDTLNARTARVANKAVNKSLLAGYKRILGEMFDSWTLKEEIGNRISLLDIKTPRINPLTVAGELKDCIILSHSWGKLLILTIEQLKNAEIKECIQNYDLVAFHLNTDNPEITRYQHFPSLEFRLKENIQLEYKELRRYFNASKKITVFDKFFSTSSIPVKFVRELLKGCDSDFKLTIILERMTSPVVESIKQSIHQYHQHCSITVLEHMSSSPILHDRHVYIDDCFQIDFSAGFDSLKHINTSIFQATAENKISIYSVGNSINITTIQARDLSGRIVEKTYRSA